MGCGGLSRRYSYARYSYAPESPCIVARHPDLQELPRKFRGRLVLPIRVSRGRMQQGGRRISHPCLAALAPAIPARLSGERLTSEAATEDRALC